MEIYNTDYQYLRLFTHVFKKLKNVKNLPLNVNKCIFLVFVFFQYLFHSFFSKQATIYQLTKAKINVVY